MSKIKFIQINIFKGKYLEDLISFLRNEEPDLISMQEVTTFNFNLYHDKTIKLFEYLRKQLEMDGFFHGDLKLKNDEKSIFGNAVFSRNNIDSSKVLILKEYIPLTLEEIDGESAHEIRPKIARHLIDTVVNMNGKLIHVMSWHGAWTAPPTDTKETLRQAGIVADYLSDLDGPFILGGDLNNTIKSKTVGLINKVSKNLMFESKAKQTTHPKVHKIVPISFLIDYIFTSKKIELLSIKVPNVTVSDHLPVVAELEI